MFKRPPTYTVRKNRYDNWYGYEGNRRVEMFFGRSDEQEMKAREWLIAKLEETKTALCAMSDAVQRLRSWQMFMAGTVIRLRNEEHDLRALRTPVAVVPPKEKTVADLRVGDIVERFPYAGGSEAWPVRVTAVHQARQRGYIIVDGVDANARTVRVPCGHNCGKIWVREQ